MIQNLKLRVAACRFIFFLFFKSSWSNKRCSQKPLCFYPCSLLYFELCLLVSKNKVRGHLFPSHRMSSHKHATLEHINQVQWDQHLKDLRKVFIPFNGTGKAASCLLSTFWQCAKCASTSFKGNFMPSTGSEFSCQDFTLIGIKRDHITPVLNIMGSSIFITSS